MDTKAEDKLKEIINGCIKNNYKLQKKFDEKYRKFRDTMRNKVKIELLNLNINRLSWKKQCQ